MKFTTAQEIFASLQIMSEKRGKSWKRLKKGTSLIHVISGGVRIKRKRRFSVSFFLQRYYNNRLVIFEYVLRKPSYKCSLIGYRPKILAASINACIFASGVPIGSWQPEVRVKPLGES